MEHQLDLLANAEYNKAVEAHRKYGAPKVSDLFKIPSGTNPSWSAFFEKVLAHLERECAVHEHTLLSLEGRYERMGIERVGEFDMLEGARRTKKKGNEAYLVGDFRDAQQFYRQAISLFPTPDSMNNYAACALKLNEFNDAERYATMALNMGLLTSPTTIAKAHMRRAEARMMKANFHDCLEDATYALSLDVDIVRSSAEQMITRVEELISSIDSPSKRKKYLAEVPGPSPRMTLAESVWFTQRHGLGMVRLSVRERADIRSQEVPVF